LVLPCLAAAVTLKLGERAQELRFLHSASFAAAAAESNVAVA